MIFVTNQTFLLHFQLTIYEKIMSAENEGCYNISASAICELKNHRNRKSWDYVQRVRQLIMKLKEEHTNDIPVLVLQLIRILEKIDESLNCLEASTSKQDLLESTVLAVEYISGNFFYNFNY